MKFPRKTEYDESITSSTKKVLTGRDKIETYVHHDNNFQTTKL